MERAVTIVFEKIDLTLGDYGLFWSEVRSDFPLSEAAAPVASEIEQFEGFRPIQRKVELLDASALPRALFRNEAKAELIQLQSDRFSFNWIKRGDEHEYPHSEAVFDQFFKYFEQFIAYVQRRGLGNIVPLQCEITNVNVIRISDVGNTFADVATVIKLPDLSPREPQLELESQMMGAKHVMIDDSGKPFGRVHSVAQPSLRADTQELVYRFDITARGAPIGPGVEGAKHFFDDAVSAVNGVFLAIVTQAGRQFWGEIDGNRS